MTYFGGTILLIERGNTVYLHDKEFISQYISGGAHPDLIAGTSMALAHKMTDFDQLHFMDYLFSISYALLNDKMGGWLINLHLILFTEQIELLGLVWFFRRMFKPVQTISSG